MAEPKDKWDIADVILRGLVPITVGVMLLFWNNQRTTQQTAATMTEIAVGILSEEPKDEQSDPLRSWAIEVLKNPSDPPTLSDDAAKLLRTENLPSTISASNFKNFTSTISAKPRNLELMEEPELAE